MALILVVDDFDWQREALCSLLQTLGHQTCQARDLKEVRATSVGKAGAEPVLCLVELVRRQGNGFGLACWLQSKGLGRAVLLSDRAELADRLWARARGIEWTLSRALDAAAFSAQLTCILQALTDDKRCA